MGAPFPAHPLPPPPTRQAITEQQAPTTQRVPTVLHLQGINIYVDPDLPTCPQLLPPRPHVCPLHPCLCSCPAKRSISTFFLNPLRVSSGIQSCPALWDPMDCSRSGSSVHGLSQARILEWVAISFSRGSPWPRDRTQVSCTAGGFTTTVTPGKPTCINTGYLIFSFRHTLLCVTL